MIIAAGGGLAAASIGELHQHAHTAPRSAAAFPHQVGVVPPRAGAFQHRPQGDLLREAVADGGSAVLRGAVQRRMARGLLSGMGGVGKTQLAADHVRSAWAAGEVDLVVWVTAADRISLVAGLAQAGVEVAGADPSDPQAAAEAFVAWLEPKAGQRPCRWLVVLDDVADPADLRALWPPLSATGRTLVTTRRRDLAPTDAGWRRIDVGVFSPVEAVAYLTGALNAYAGTEPDTHSPVTEQGRDQDLVGLAEDLGHLPLALSQAAAYMTVDAGITAAVYRDLLADRTRSLAALTPDNPPDGQTASMAGAWALSMEYADRLAPCGLARPMLELVAFLDPNSIPVGALTCPPALAYLAAHRSASAFANKPAAGVSVGGEGTIVVDLAGVSSPEAYGALRALHRLSLLNAPSPAGGTTLDGQSSDGQGVRVHQLVQRAARDALAPHRYAEAARAAADALLAVWPRIERDTALAQALRASATAVSACATKALHVPDTHPVLFRLGRSLGESGQVSAAIAYHRQLHHAIVDCLGPDHPDALATRRCLARWRGNEGDTTGAVDALADLVPDMLRVLGQDHPDTLGVRRNLATWRAKAGDRAGAADALADLLPDMLRVLGADHPDTLTTRHALASTRGMAGEEAVALELLAELLLDMVRVLGPSHPQTLAVRSGLADWRGRTGDAPGAADVFAELLADMVRVLGPDHPDTLSLRQPVNHWIGEAGDASRAAQGYAELVSAMVRVLGPDHPDTLMARGDLAYWLGKRGDASGAAQAFAEVVPDMIRVMGPSHPLTVATRGSLLLWRVKAGDDAGAAETASDLLPEMVRVLGPDHVITAAVRSNLALWQE